MLLEYLGNETNPTIPKEITQIGSNAFKGNKTITELTIPTTVKKLCVLACCKIVNLKKVTLHDNLILAGLCFADCDSLELTELIIPEVNTAINYGLLLGISKTTVVYVPKSVTRIGQMAFWTFGSSLTIYYAGSEAEWTNIPKENAFLSSAYIYYYSETTPTESGNFWHYVDGVMTKW